MFIEGTQQESQQRAEYLIARGYKWAHDVAEANVYIKGDRGIYVNTSDTTIFFSCGIFTDAVEWETVVKMESHYKMHYLIIDELFELFGDLISVKIERNKLEVIVPTGNKDKAEKYTNDKAEEIAFMNDACSCKKQGIEVVIIV